MFIKVFSLFTPQNKHARISFNTQNEQWVNAHLFVKNSIYECGFETITERWSQFNFRYYSIALLFVIFDVEVVFLFPWAASFGTMSAQFGLFVLAEMSVFIGILVLGWVYAWKKGSLEWS